MMERITIRDIAREAGVSKGAVSYALNGRPGVSESTRARILDVADRLGWAPNRTARLLSGSRTDAFGLVLARSPRVLAAEPFYMEFVAGIESVLADRASALLLQVVPDLDSELAIYRRWWSERRVDATIVVDLRLDDPRMGLLKELELPAVCVGSVEHAQGLSCVWIDEGASMAEAVRHLAGLGHRRIGRVAGLGDLAHTRVRDEAFFAVGAGLGLETRIEHTDFSADAGRRATRALMTGPDRPTALMFDNDLMAVTSLGVLHEMGIDVPGEVSVLAWDGSPLCEITTPQLSAMSHDVVAFGAHVARRVTDLVDGAAIGTFQERTPVMLARGSTAPPPGPAPTTLTCREPAPVA
ncbi:DNA-binding LacI/PurR family transcriptional regulator [Friedmanniella endophytica]|uniref:DNA-binding LacI/PurR family transcriptional regulator n=2 Tax=Microlunatus kandeliicorticis TaxID=1759536 RepID=A0A7W3IQQ2_9ACTN|nr:DNA-binding LacI/PurR family transcriptional regulator [Microlunatus kandeliicorticis]